MISMPAPVTEHVRLRTPTSETYSQDYESAPINAAWSDLCLPHWTLGGTADDEAGDWFRFTRRSRDRWTRENPF